MTALRIAADSQAAAEAARAARLSESLDRHKQRATKACQQPLGASTSLLHLVKAADEDDGPRHII